MSSQVTNDQIDSSDMTANDSRVYSLVRLALSCEYSKKPLKREDIYEFVNVSLRRPHIFLKAMELANNYLSENFGFKIVELPMVISSNVSAASTSASRKAAITQKSKVASSSNQSAQSFALISNLSIDDRALIPRTSRDPLKLAIIQIILVVIKLSADNLDHQTLVSSLINLGLILDKNSEELKIGKLVDVLDDLKKDRYILKTKQPLSNNSFYSWGPRAFVEFPPENLANLLFKIATSGRNKDSIEPRFQEKAFKVLSLKK